MTMHVRPKRPGGERFLFVAYASRRTQEMELRDWSADPGEDFVRMQFNMQDQHDVSQFPTAETRIVEENEKPFWRTILNQADREIRFMDFARLPKRRDAGTGRDSMRPLV
jgi:hypothetical protein